MTNPHTSKTPNHVFVARRKRLLQSLQDQGGGICVLTTAPEQTRNRDSNFPYRADSYFYYLTGFDEPEAALVLRADSHGQKAALFCREKDLAKEIWDGYRLGPLAAPATLEVDEGFAITELEQRLQAWLPNQAAVCWPFAAQPGLDQLMHSLVQQVKLASRGGQVAPFVVRDICEVLDDMRLHKDQEELRLMRRAASISALAHQRAMRICQPGLREYHLEAELLHEFRRNGSEFAAYTSIVAAGANSCILHYRAGDAELHDGDLCLIDAGCELHMYASDITRTFPVNGRFSQPQRELYELVLAAQAKAIEQVKPGALFTDPHQAATRVLIEGMLHYGLLDPQTHGGVEDVLKTGAYKQFYMHRTGHWLGMDVHDCGDYGQSTQLDGRERSARALQAGMVLTIEPGIYVRPDPKVPEKYWNIGIRIEDDILVTATSCENLTYETPKSVQDIESLMASAN